MKKSDSEKLSKGDVISFVSIIIMGIIAFLGVNYHLLGDRVSSICIALLLVILMAVSVFVAAFGQMQNRNQSKWKMVETIAVIVYLVCLVPTYMYSGHFLNIQFGKTDITNQIQADVNDVNEMFHAYETSSKRRADNYALTLGNMLADKYQKKNLEDLFEEPVEKINNDDINRAAESFRNMLIGSKFDVLKSEKDELTNSCVSSFNNWNVLLLPKYAQDLSMAKNQMADKLQESYDETSPKLEDKSNIPSFNAKSYVSDSDTLAKFRDIESFSLSGILFILVFGILGLLKFILGTQRSILEIKVGTADNITKNGGFSI